MIAQPNHGPDKTVLRIRDLRTQLFVRDRAIKAVDGIDLTVRRGATLGIVGESGCGKSMTALSIMRLVPDPPGRITGGQIHFSREAGAQPVDLVSLEAGGREMCAIRGGDIAMIFQEPMTSLNPLYRVGSQIAECVRLHQGVGRGEAMGRALDVSVQAQVFNLLQELKEKFGLALLFIAHDLAVVESLCDRTAVMYVGHIVELGETRSLLGSPLHPYTEALISAVPSMVPDGHRQRIRMLGELPSPSNPPPGCVFHPRCRYAKETCRKQVPRLREIRPGHHAACHFAGELHGLHDDRLESALEHVTRVEQAHAIHINRKSLF